MEDPNMLKGNDIENLVTRFFYKENQLCFQILFQCQADKVIAYSEYDDYTKYKEAFNVLIEKKTNNEVIILKEINQEISYIN